MLVGLLGDARRLPAQPGYCQWNIGNSPAGKCAYEDGAKMRFEGCPISQERFWGM